MNKKSGFSLLEMLIVIAIIGIIGAVIMPNFKRSTPRYEREEFIARFNALTQLAWQQSLVLNKAHQVNVDVKKKTIFILVDSGEKNRSDEPVFKPIVGLAQSTSMLIPDQIEFRQFFIEGFDMIAKHTRSKAEEMWFYIIPEGMAQDVIVNMVDTKDTVDGVPRQVGLVLNPFSAQFKIYDTFQKP